MTNRNAMVWRLGLQRASALVIGVALAATACGGGGDDGDGGGGGGTSSGGKTGSGGKSGGTAGGTAQIGCDFDNTDPGDMVEVPGGSFMMGCDPASDPQCEAEEQPAHMVTLSGFSIDKTEVTQAQYSACVAAGDCDPPECDVDCGGPNLPQGCVKWQSAKDYCAFAGKRLPTEAEWEYAARGDDGRLYPWGDDAPTCELANLAGCENAARDVGSSPGGASPFGALDMAGNMVEMVADWYADDYYASSPSDNPTGPASGGAQYSGRGGGWKSMAKWLRTAERDWYAPDDEGGSLGFRCAK